MEVYETKGKDGTPSFSDQADPSATPVKIGPTNSADKIDLPPPESKPRKQPAKASSENAQPDTAYGGNQGIYYDDGRRNLHKSPLRNKVPAERPVNLPAKPGPSKPGHTIKPGHTVRPAGQAHRAAHK